VLVWFAHIHRAGLFVLMTAGNACCKLIPIIDCFNSDLVLAGCTFHVAATILSISGIVAYVYGTANGIQHANKEIIKPDIMINASVRANANICTNLYLNFDFSLTPHTPSDCTCHAAARSFSSCPFYS
jgi:hypothetical protein